MSRPIGIDLFAGAGGLSLGFEWAGFDIAAAVELDPVHCATHEYNFPKCKAICASVTDITGKEIIEKAGIKNPVDVVFGGAPCQGFSMIGKRALDDPRNELISHFVRLVKEISPRFFVFENVKGLTVGKHKKFLLEIIELFKDSDYSVKLPYQVLNASDYGVPQNRNRLFLIGYKKGENEPRYPNGQNRITVAEAISDLPEAEDYVELQSVDYVKVKHGRPTEYAKQLRELNGKPFHFGYRRDYDPNLLTSSLTTNHSELSRSRFAATPLGKTEPVSRFFKLDPNGVCNTLRAGTASDRGAFTSPRPIHPYTPRCITVREAARLHSYPDWFRFHATKWHGFRQIGNSVPPKLAMAVAEEIIKTMSIKRRRPKEILVQGNPVLLSYTMAQAAAYFGVSASVIPKRLRKAA